MIVLITSCKITAHTRVGNERCKCGTQDVRHYALTAGSAVPSLVRRSPERRLFGVHSI